MLLYGDHISILLCILIWTCSAESLSSRTKSWFSSGSIPLIPTESSGFSTKLENLSAGIRLKRSLRPGWTTSVDLTTKGLQDDKPSNIYICELASIAGEVPIVDDYFISFDASFKVPTQEGLLTCRLLKGDALGIESQYSTFDGLGRVGVLTRAELAGRRFAVKPSYDFKTGETEVAIEGDVNAPGKELSSKALLTVKRDKKGSMDGSVQIRSSFHRGRDILTPKFNFNKSSSIEWQHNFDAGSLLKVFVDDNKNSKLEWEDTLDSGGKWVASVDGRVDDLKKATIRFRREFAV